MVQQSAIISWENFKKVWINEKEYEMMQEIDSIQNGLAHRPFNPNTDKHRQFLLILQKKIETVKQKLPHLHRNEFSITSIQDAMR